MGRAASQQAESAQATWIKEPITLCAKMAAMNATKAPPSTLAPPPPRLRLPGTPPGLVYPPGPGPRRLLRFSNFSCKRIGWGWGGGRFAIQTMFVLIGLGSTQNVCPAGQSNQAVCPSPSILCVRRQFSERLLMPHTCFHRPRSPRATAYSQLLMKAPMPDKPQPPAGSAASSPATWLRTACRRHALPTALPLTQLSWLSVDVSHGAGRFCERWH